MFRPSSRPWHPLLIGQKVGLWPVDPRDVGDWLAARRENQAYLTPWEPAWPHDALSWRAFARRAWHSRREWQQDRGYSFLIFSPDRARLYGGIALTDIQRSAAQKATIGYWMGQSWQGQGRMSEALTLCCHFAFEILQFHRLEASCVPANLPSRRVLEKSGFIAEGLARDYLQINHQWQDHILYARLHPAYPPALARWSGGV